MKTVKVILLLMVTIFSLLGCSNSKATEMDQPLFDEQLEDWAKQIKIIEKTYINNYAISVGYGAYNDNKAHYEAVNKLRAEWTNYHTSIDWNPQSNQQEQLLSTIKKINLSMEKMLEYKAYYFNSNQSSDYSTMNEYARYYDEQIAYFKTQSIILSRER